MINERVEKINTRFKTLSNLISMETYIVYEICNAVMIILEMYFD